HGGVHRRPDRRHVGAVPDHGRRPSDHRPAVPQRAAHLLLRVNRPEGTLGMPNNTARPQPRLWSVLGLLLLPLVCCALTLLIAAGVLDGVGAVLRSPCVIAAAAVLLIGGTI